MDAIDQTIAHFKLNVTDIQPVEGSYSSIVRILTLQNGQQVVLKIPFIQRKLHRELHALRYLQADLPVAHVLDAWVPEDDQPGALLLSLLPGKIITDKVSTNLAYQLGELLARLHSHKLSAFGDVYDHQVTTSEGWWDQLHLSFANWLTISGEVLSPTIIQRTRDAYDQLRRSLPAPDGPCYVHFDYRPDNVLIQRGRISGLVDFESSRGGSADLDFIKVKNELWEANPETREPFLAGYISVRALPEIDRTLPLYSLHNALGGVGWCVRRSKLDDPFFDENLARLMKILDPA